MRRGYGLGLVFPQKAWELCTNCLLPQWSVLFKVSTEEHDFPNISPSMGDAGGLNINQCV